MNTPESQAENFSEIGKKSSFYKVLSEQSEEIKRHKWYESEKAGHDVGKHHAVVDWTAKHKLGWQLTHREKEQSTGE